MSVPAVVRSSRKRAEISSPIVSMRAGAEFRARDADAFKAYFGLTLGGRIRELMKSWAPDEPGTGLPARIETIGEEISARFRELRTTAGTLTDRV
ncbi:MAG: hypothetical protein ACKOFI_00965, partial [Phycisphaerales bacterium]